MEQLMKEAPAVARRLDTDAIRSLVVEDNPADVLLITDSLRSSRTVHFEVAMSLSEAKSMLDEHSFDIILTDLALPDSDGLETYYQLAASAPDVPVVILSGSDDIDLAIEAIRDGAQDWVSKREAIYGDHLERVLRFALERYRMQDQLRRQEATLRRMIERSPDGVLIVARDGRCLLANRAAERMVDDTDTIFRSLNGDQAAAGKVFRLDRGDTSSSIVEAMINELDWLGEPALLVTLRDVTDLAVAAEAAIHEEQTLSHELRTPVASMIGYVEMLIDEDFGPLTDEQSEVLAVIQRNGRRLLSLVSELLTLSKVDSGAVGDGAETELALASILGNVRSMVDPLAADTGVEVSWPADGTPILLLGNLEQMERIFINLLTNAVKFTPAGGQVTVTTEATTDRVRVAVADTGVGIDAEDLDRIFERFFRAQSSYANAIAGTGIGLSLTKALVEAHGGSISVESTIEVGTTFVVELPRLPADGGSACFR